MEEVLQTLLVLMQKAISNKLSVKMVSSAAQHPKINAVLEVFLAIRLEASSDIKVFSMNFDEKLGQ